MALPVTLPEKLAADAGRKREALMISAQHHGICFSEDMFDGSLTPVLAFSDFVAQSCTRDPEMLQELVESGDLFRPYDADDCDRKITSYVSGQMDDTQLMTQLRHFRRREMTRIAWRDLAGWADLQEVMSTLSNLAESCLRSALAILSEGLYQEYGTPLNGQGDVQQLVVLGMGKLGARELNFSSDIDLIFAYPCAGTTAGGVRSVSHEVFFVQLCRKLMSTLTQRTSDGFVFRVDANLRPFGANGPLVMNFESMEDYYLHQGREWERYAWIKARVVAGDHTAGGQLLTSLKPFIFRRYLDFGVFDALREMKLKISREVSRNSMRFNIKLGPGGIREIEFFAQVFQLIRGGVNPELQTPSLQDALRLLVQHHTISQAVYDQLLQAYDFLRRTEHRLQAFSDQQTHQIPEDNEERRRLAVSMGFSESESFFQELDIQTNHVHTCFSTILESPDTASVSMTSQKSVESSLNSLWAAPADPEQDVWMLQELGFMQPDAILNLLNHLREDPATRALSMEGKRRLDHLMPCLLKEVIPLKDQEVALDRVIDILKAIERRTSYLALLLEAPHARRHLVELACASPLIATFLSRRPALLDELLDARMLYNPPRKAELENELTEKMRQIPANDLEYQIEQLCIFKEVNVLRVAAADVTGALPLMRTSDHLTELAETVLAQTLEMSWNYLIEKHGHPVCALDGAVCDKGFAVIGYGKLGGIELGYGSDLDMVFLHAGVSGVTSGAKAPLDNAQFFARLGQRVIHMLTTQTSAGSLYEVDMRLRPSGSSGILVCHVDGFEQYQIQNAWTWEHQALVRARPVGGDIRVGERFQHIRENVLSAFREPEILRRDVSEMRDKMRKEHGVEGSGFFDIKQGNGGIVDIEFMVQYLVLRHAHEHPSLLQWTDNVRLLETLIESGILADYQAVALKDAYLTYRAAVHRLNLQKAPATVPEKRFREHRSHVKALWNHIMTAS